MENKPKTLREWSDIIFQEKLDYARKYSDINGSLDINKKFTTNDGYSYDKNGKINLGEWVEKQAKTVDPNSKRGKMLTDIGMIWNFYANKKCVFDLCRQYRIDIEINYLLINRLSYQEFKAKTNYLLANGYNLTNRCGELHEVFYLQNKELVEKYGVSKEEIINQYFDYQETAKLIKY